ncbi:podocan-like [Diadema antillarum]|uniref:podocan-like n=1 Tax=Diadema antillarum TaxID=105358 RepID=UPI003A87E3C6
MPLLKTLNLFSNYINVVSDSDFQRVSLARKLQLHLPYNNLRDDFWRGFPSLLRLYLAGNRLTRVIAMPTSLKTLHMENNLIQSVEELKKLEVLEILNLSECRFLALTQSGLIRMPFLYAPYLMTLVLSYNEIVSISPLMSSRVFGLASLHLNKNHLTSIPARSFANCCPSLDEIDIADNDIRYIEHSAFYGTILATVRLDGNELMTTSPGGLSTFLALRLARNPWRCDCEIVPFRDWLLRQLKGLSDSIVCSTPLAYKGIDVKHVPISNVCLAGPPAREVFPLNSDVLSMSSSASPSIGETLKPVHE